MGDPAINHPLTPKRRWFLKAALAIGAAGAAMGGLVYWHRGVSDGKLTPHGRDVFRGLAIGFVGPMLPQDKTAREAVLDAHLAQVETFLGTMPPTLQVEVNAVTGLLANMPTRRLLTGLGSRWTDSSDAEIAEAIESMRLNPLPSTRLTYQVVRALTCMAFFTNSDNWSLTGYPGPVQI